MVKWRRLCGSQYLGFWPLGLLFWALQGAPYLMIPLMHLEENFFLTMPELYPWLNAAEKVLGVSCILLMVFVVNDRCTAIHIECRKDLLLFAVPMLMLVLNYFGWLMYFGGGRNVRCILFFLVAMPPLYYASLGVWRKNPALLVTGILFLITHVAHIWCNFRLSNLI